MQHQILVRVVHRCADALEQTQALGHSEPVPVAVFRDRETVDVLDDEIRKLSVGDTAIEQLRDVRVRQRREDLPLGQEAAMQLVSVSAAAQQLHRDAAAELAVVALGKVDDAHPSASDLPQHLIRADLPASLAIGQQRSCRGRRRLREYAVGPVVTCQQRFDFPAQHIVVPAELIEQRYPSGAVKLDDRLEHLLDALAARSLDFEPVTGTVGHDGSDSFR